MENYRITELQESEKYDENIDRYGDDNPCVRCGKPIKNEKYMVHLVQGGSILAVADENKYYEINDDESGDMGMHLIGSECKKHIHKDFIHIIK